jgi:hypothetical protein
MKKLLLLVTVFSLGFTGLVFSQEAERTSEESFQIVNFLIRDGLNRNFAQIQQESLNLTPSQRITLYNMNENTFGVPLALNLLLGFGIGSLVQGDVVGGVSGLAGDAVGITLLIVFFTRIIAADNWLTSEIDSLNAQILADPIRLARIREAQEERDRRVEAAFPLIGVSIGVLAVSRLAQIVFPLVYSPRYNNRLREALNMGVTLSPMSFVPSFGLEKTGGVNMMWNFSF